MRGKLQEYALIAEIISAVCIVLSLIFVGMQVDQSAQETAANSRAIEATVREQLLNADMAILQLGSTDANLQTARPPDPDDTDLLYRASNFYYMIFRTRENYWKHHQNGLLDDETWRAYRQVFLLGASNPYYIRVWNDTVARELVNREFADEINSFLVANGVDLDDPKQNNYPMAGTDI